MVDLVPTGGYIEQDVPCVNACQVHNSVYRAIEIRVWGPASEVIDYLNDAVVSAIGRRQNGEVLDSHKGTPVIFVTVPDTHTDKVAANPAKIKLDPGTGRNTKSGSTRMLRIKRWYITTPPYSPTVCPVGWVIITIVIQTAVTRVGIAKTSNHTRIIDKVILALSRQ